MFGGNNPALQPDITQFDELQRQLADTPAIPIAALQTSDGSGAPFLARTIPTRLNLTRWTQQGNATDAVLLVPRNPARLALIMTNPFSTNIFVSFGPSTYNALNQYVGMRISGGQPLIIPGGVVPVDELWVWSGAATETLVCFEGVEATESNA